MLDPTPDNALPPPEREVEAALAQLRPAATTINAAAGLFEAGRRAGESAARRQLVVWRSAAAILLAAGAAALAFRPTPTVTERERIVYVEHQSDPDADPPAVIPVSASGNSVVAEPSPTAESMLSLRQVALEQGIDRLPHLATSGKLTSLRVRDAALP